MIGYGGLDTDADGVNDVLDCAPTDPSVHPGSDEIGYDGIDGDCAGGDDFDLDADGARALPWGFDEDDLDLDIAFSMAVTGSCAATVGFVVDGASPGAAVEVYRGEYSAQGQYQLPAPHPCRSSGHELHLGGGRAARVDDRRRVRPRCAEWRGDPGGRVLRHRPGDGSVDLPGVRDPWDRAVRVV